MNILNMKTLINFINSDIDNSPLIEHGYFSTLINNSNENYLINNIEKIGNPFKSELIEKIIIPKEQSFYFLLKCSKSNVLPMISHTHVLYGVGDDISFSQQDKKFINSFCKVGCKLGNIKKYIFFVTNGKYFELLIRDNNHNEIIKRGRNEEFFN